MTYYHQDQLGSTRALTNSSGTVVATYTYDPYGQLNGSTGTVTNPFRYAGQYADAETGLLYLRARYYDPDTASFLTRDPLGAITGTPYAYANNDPLNTVDPSGLCGEASSFIGPTIPCKPKPFDFEYKSNTLDSTGQKLSRFDWQCVKKYGPTFEESDDDFFWVGVVMTKTTYRMHLQQVNWTDSKNGVLYSAQRTMKVGTTIEEAYIGDFKIGFNPFTSFSLESTLPYEEQVGLPTIRGRYVTPGASFGPATGISLF